MKAQKFDELSDEELERIEGRVRAATVGPWLSYVAGRDAEADCSFIELGMCNEVGTFKSIEVIGATAADQDFIANARQDIPRLLQAIRYLRGMRRSPAAQADELDARAVMSAVDRSELPLSRSA